MKRLLLLFSGLFLGCLTTHVGQEGGPCNLNRQCLPGFECVNGICVSSESRDALTSDDGSFSGEKDELGEVAGCGNGVCEQGENCQNCPKDCPCQAGEKCFKGKCCRPDCTNKECGDDGCGGLCGACGPGQRCADGRCEDFLKWKYPTQGWIEGAVATGPDGEVYVGSGDGELYCIDMQGNLLWKTDLGNKVTGSPTVGPDGTIYVGAYNELVAIGRDGTIKWRFKTPDWIYHVAPAITSQSVIVVPCKGRKVFGITPSGEKVWEFSTSDQVQSSPAVGPTGIIVFGDDSGAIYSLDSTGRLVWKVSTKEHVRSSPAIDKDGTIYVGSYDRSVYAIDAGGNVKWTFKTEGEVGGSPVIGKDGTILVGGHDNKLYALDPEGHLKWKVDVGGWIDSAPVVSEQGLVFVGTSAGSMVAIDSNGRRVWAFNTEGGIFGSAALNFAGILFFGSKDGSVYALNTGAGPLAHSPWPKFHHDLRNSGRFTDEQGSLPY